MIGKFTKNDIVAIVLFFVIMFGIPGYIDYQRKTSCDLTYLSYCSVKTELNECVDFFTGMCSDVTEKYGSDAEFTFYPSHYNKQIGKYDRYTLTVGYSDSENNRINAELKTINDSAGKIWGNIKKIQAALNNNGFDLFRQFDPVGFRYILIVNNELNFCFLTGHSGIKGNCLFFRRTQPRSFFQRNGKHNPIPLSCKKLV